MVVKRVALIVGTVVLGCFCYWESATSWTQNDPYVFLAGNHPLVTGVAPIIEDSGYRSKGFTDEYRIYSWHESPDAIETAAKAVLPPLGFKWERSAWVHPDGRSVYIEPGRRRPVRGLFRGMDKDRDWVTVTCAEPIDGALISHLRYALEPNELGD